MHCHHLGQGWGEAASVNGGRGTSKKMMNACIYTTTRTKTAQKNLRTTKTVTKYNKK